jgi:hypothetical protein
MPYTEIIRKITLHQYLKSKIITVRHISNLVKWLPFGTWYHVACYSQSISKELSASIFTVL